MSVLVVYNPVCGDSTAEQFFGAHVLPRLHAANRPPTEIVCTRAPGHAGTSVLDFLDRHPQDPTVVLGSGDGTLHEIVNHLAFATSISSPIRFVLVPCGTANALYASLFRPAPLEETVAYKLRSLDAFIRSSTPPKPLTLALSSLPDGRPVVSVVVTSTALHAAILKDSEKLREQIPGIERFKIAAQQNITKWYASHVKLLPVPSSGIVHVYDPQKGGFIGSNEAGAALNVHGPFAYFLSTVNVDRLEPEFRINPTVSMIPPTGASMDLIIVRPQRDPTVVLDTPESRERFAHKAVAVFTAAYQDGKHLGLRYADNGDIVEGGSGNTVIECFRCGGWEWTPDVTDEDAHLLCADGTIFEIGKHGRAICTVAQGCDATLTGFEVYV